MTSTIQSNAVVVVFLFFIFMRFLLKIVTYPIHDQLLDELQHLDGSLAVGGHHHVAVCLPTNCTDKLVDVLVLAVAVQEAAHRVELELEQVLAQTCNKGKIQFIILKHYNSFYSWVPNWVLVTAS